ncbi:MAG: DEAD/DEAH box helicase [Ilumatobacter sp.]|nr:DEAD/DEAH box helicase [Ilumatobacter sp.]MCB0984248.1 DEAD/DEAH box helicase [Ilumatobacter sp.]
MTPGTPGGEQWTEVIPVDIENDGDVEQETAGFADLGLREELLLALDELGYEEPTPIQRETIPHLLAGHDLVGQAATGTGKTAAFALPALQLVEGRPGAPLALVLVPTRELAMQVNEALFRYGRRLGAASTPVYGGQPIYKQLQALDRGVHIVVGTPGRVLDHIGRGSLPLGGIRMVVLDEADEMLDMGFADDIETILDAIENADTDVLSPGRQTVMFSATMPPRITAIAKKHLTDPVRINVTKGDTKASMGKVRQVAFVVPRVHKPAALGRVLDIEAPGGALVFCRTRTEVDQLTETMNARGYRAEALHGGMDQAQRDRVMGRLRDGTADLLVATDVAARGLDVDTLTHVVNYDVPSAPESYVHRIGRVGRAGREGVAITLAEPREQRLLRNIEQLTKQTIAIEKVPTIADLRAAQLDQTVTSVREALAADDLHEYEPVLHALKGDADLREIALAAIRLFHEAAGNTTDENEIPDLSERMQRREREDRGDRPDRGTRSDRMTRDDRGNRSPADQGDTGFVYVGIGRKAGLRPGDLVGAIANETDLEGRQIGPIRITDLYAVVGVPEDRADGVIDALRNTMIRGRTPTVRRYTDNGGDRPAKQGHRGQRRTSYGDRDDRGPRTDRPGWTERPTRGGDRPGRGGDRPNRGKGGKW